MVMQCCSIFGAVLREVLFLRCCNVASPQTSRGVCFRLGKMNA